MTAKVNRQGGGKGHCAAPVQRGPTGRLRLAHPRPGQQERRGRDQRCRQKDRPPAQRLDQHPGHDRAKGQPHAKGRAQHAEGAGTRGPLELLRQSGRSAGQGSGGAHALHPAQQIDHQRRWRPRQCQRGQRKQSDSGDEHAFAPDPVGHRARHHQQAAEGQHEAIGDPCQQRRAAAQILADGGGGHGSRGKAERQDQRRKADGGQHGQALSGG